MRYSPVPSKLFIKNRAKLATKLNGNAIAMIHSNHQMPRNGDLFHPFRQSSDLFYLCGIEQEETALLLFPSHPESSMREILFIRRPNEEMEIWEGKKLTLNEAQKISGIENIRFIDELDSVYKQLAISADKLYFNRNENPRASSAIATKDEIWFNAISKQFPLHTFCRLAPLLTECRLYKEPEEIDLMKKACSITDEAFRAVLKDCKAGMKEYEIEAILSYHFTRLGANGHAYEPIIANGKNACYLHYNKNNNTLKSGDLLFMDFGAEYANYSADCSRAIPVSGRFNPRQADIYNAVLRLMKQAKQMLRPGVLLPEYHKEVCKIMDSELIGLGLYTKEEAMNQNPQKPLYFKYYMHGTSHFMGLDTHDVGDKQTILKPGMVLSCEPGIYIMGEGIGIRLENDILITNDEPIDLMGNIPVEKDEIETLMNT